MNKRTYIGTVDERGRATVLKGRVCGRYGDTAFVQFRIAGTREDGEMLVHSRFVRDTWFAAWRDARRIHRVRFGAGAPKRYATTAPNGAKDTVRPSDGPRTLRFVGRKGAQV